MEARLVRLENTEHLKDYPGYGVDTEGNVWSFKWNKIKKLSPGWKKKGEGYKYVLLMDKYGNKRNFLVHRLVALAFIPTKDITLKITHKNGDSSDNRLENLEWYIKKEKLIDKPLGVNKEIITKIREVHMASIRKGLKVPDTYDFMNDIIENALDEHIKRYGLRKVMT